MKKWTLKVYFQKSKGFTVRTIDHVWVFLEKFGFEKIFGRSMVMEKVNIDSINLKKDRTVL